MSVKYDDQEALRLMALGDESAFKYLYDRYYGRVFQVAQIFLKSDDLAEDIVQDVFLTLYEKRKFVSINQFEFYLRTAARNRCINFLKRAESINKASNAFAHDMGKIDASAERAEFLQWMERMENLMEEAIEKMPEKRKKIFVMKKLQGLSYESIALELNIPIGTVQPYLKRGLRDVTKHLKHNVGSYVTFLFSFSLGL